MSPAEIERQQAQWDERARAAQAAAAQAYARLLDQAEHHSSGQIRRIAQFLASTFNGQAFPLDLFELRTVDVEIADDMLTCIDALRWGKADLYKLVPHGIVRVLDVLKRWDIAWPEA